MWKVRLLSKSKTHPPPPSLLGSSQLILHSDMVTISRAECRSCLLFGVSSAPPSSRYVSLSWVPWVGAWPMHPPRAILFCSYPSMRLIYSASSSTDFKLIFYLSACLLSGRHQIYTWMNGFMLVGYLCKILHDWFIIKVFLCLALPKSIIAFEIYFYSWKVNRDYAFKIVFDTNIPLS